LEIESKLNDGPLDNNLSVGAMVKKDGRYYIAAGKVYTREAREDSSWSSIPSPGEDYICQDIAVLDDTLYAVFFTTDGTTSELYYLSGDDTFTIVDSLEDKQCVSMVSVSDASGSDYLFVSEKVGIKQYKVHSRKSGDKAFEQSKVDIEGLSDNIIDFHIEDGAFQKGANTIWLISGNRLITTTGGATLGSATSVPDTDALLGGIYYSETLEVLFVATAEGTLYGYREASGWGDGSSGIEDSLRFYDVLELPLGDEVMVVVGTEEGYYEHLFSETPADAEDIDTIELKNPGLNGVTSTFNYLNTKLADGVVRTFLSDNENLFACTLNQGLWRNESRDGERVWNRE
jgi:hypothetical protein